MNVFVKVFLICISLLIFQKSEIKATALENQIPKNVDVTDMLQNIINEKNYLFLEPGKYYISKPLVVNNSTQIIGSGSNNTILEAKNELDYLITTVQNSNETSKEHKIRSRIKIENIHINGANKVRSGIYFIYDSNCYFENVTVTRTKIGFDIRGWSHTFIHCISMYNTVGGFFSNAFNQVNFTGCFFNNNKVGLYVNGNAVSFNSCDIERNELVGCINQSKQVSFRDCFFENNGTKGLCYLKEDNSQKSSWGFVSNGSHPYTDKIQADMILCSSLKFHDNGTVRLNLGNGWLPQNTTIEKCYFYNKDRQYAVIGSAAKIRIVDNLFETKYNSVYAIIPSSSNTIVKLVEIYNNYVDRNKADGEKLEEIPPIMMLSNRTKVNDCFWTFMHYGNHILGANESSYDFGKNLYRFNETIQNVNTSTLKRNLHLVEYTSSHVVYKASMKGTNNYSFGFHSFTDDKSVHSNKSALKVNTLYCYEAEVKLSRNLNEGEKIRLTLISSKVNHAEHKTITSVNSDSYVKGSFYFYNSADVKDDNWEATITASGLKEEIDIYIRNPRFYNVTGKMDDSSNYFSYLKYALRNSNKNNMPLTSGVRVGEKMTYMGTDEALKRNLICIKSGVNGEPDIWAEISFGNIKNENLPKFEYNLMSNSGTFANRPISSSGIAVGYSYFCTDRKSPEGSDRGIVIYYKGDDIWVDALGRIVN